MIHSTHFIYGYMVSDHSDSERGNREQGFFYMYHAIDRIVHTMAFVTSVIEHWLEREIGSDIRDWSDDPLHHERTLLPQSYISLPFFILIPWYVWYQCTICFDVTKHTIMFCHFFFQIVSAELRLPIHIVSFNCDSPDTIKFLKDFTKVTGGRWALSLVMLPPLLVFQFKMPRY